MRTHFRFPFSLASAGRRKGSALLIVLGFLSFMMISAVSFAVYMRIERQASSNYRHATTARHLLNAGLYRAIDEIDAELRIPSVSGTARALKFPDWPGRVRTSAVPNGENNGQDARVLSLEALSFIPGILVNDVRRYAIPNDNDTRDANGNTWKGAKWRSLSMPSTVFGGEGVEIGRYAYVCVNVSDMLDVNVCKAAERDSVTNRISIGHLFASDTSRTTFDANYKNTDKHYETLQDFYACMYKRNDPTFGSPYHEYLQNGNDSEFDNAENHVLITDSLVKAEPTAVAQPCNVLSTLPVAAGTLTQARPGSISLQTEFQTALGNALAGRLPSGASVAGDLMATLIADYIDTDSIPKRLNMPSVEMVPMISQILVPAFVAPTVIMRQVTVGSGASAHTKNIYSLQLVSDPTALQMDVELVWPFKHQKDRTTRPNFTVEVQAYLKVIKTHAPKKSQDFMDTPTAYVQMTGSAAAPDFWDKNTSVPENCFNHVTVPLTIDASKIKIDMIDSDDGVIPGSGFVEGQPCSVAMLVFVNVKLNNDIVDRVPQMAPFLGAADPWDVEFMATPKLFFQTVASAPVARSMAVNLPIQYEWSSLEVPDPRFNYKAANWVKNTVDVNAITPKINPSTEALLGQDGRDGDIYMAVSDVGSLQSPGELGFIVRPFPQNIAGANVDFRNQISADNAEDKDYMFRTIRLYDHGAPSDLIKRAHDPIYSYFTARNADGTLAGARVNPLSDLPPVLAAATANTPLDYYWAGARKLTGMVPADTTIRKYVFDNSTYGIGVSSWAAFTNGWTKCLINAKSASQLNTTLKNNLSDVYGNNSLFGWYSKGDATKIFDGGYSASGVPANLSDPLHEIDRKMLYSFTLDSFSDRQQLFLYIIRAEATVPSFGGSVDGGMKSLAGGRAVALVWRDPYPVGYAKGTGGSDSWLNKDSKTWYASDRAQNGAGARVSPWYQHNLNRYDTSKDDTDEDGTFTDRLDGYHPHRILFFKQLDN